MSDFLGWNAPNPHGSYTLHGTGSGNGTGNRTGNDGFLYYAMYCTYRSGTVNSNTVNSKFHLIRSYYEIFFYHFPNISCLKCTVNSNFHLIRSKTLLTNDFELTVPNLYYTETGKGTRAYCFLLCQPQSLCRSRSHSRAM